MSGRRLEDVWKEVSWRFAVILPSVRSQLLSSRLSVISRRIPIVSDRLLPVASRCLPVAFLPPSGSLQGVFQSSSTHLFF